MITFPLDQIPFSERGSFLQITSRKYCGSPRLLYKACSSRVHNLWEYVSYIMPQEHGYKTDVRMLALYDKNGLGINVAGFPLIEFNACPFTDNDLYYARHTVDLKPRNETWLNLDSAMRGLGTVSCGQDTLDQNRLLKTRYRFTYSL